MSIFSHVYVSIFTHKMSNFLHIPLIFAHICAKKAVSLHVIKKKQIYMNYFLTEQCVRDILGAFLDDRGKSSAHLLIKSYQLIYFCKEIYLRVEYLLDDELYLEVVPLEMGRFTFHY